jgi:BirA family transcriptional regulator, biotin operon repressor / biotin---[acetyl-CoA-carboxylase] ligase
MVAQRVSLHEVAVPPDELPLLERLRHHLLIAAELLRSSGMQARLNDLRQRDFLLGQIITVETVAKAVTGEARGISDRGELRLLLEDGTERTFRSGHVVPFRKTSPETSEPIANYLSP